jgi:protein-tyrosine phosphatase
MATALLRRRLGDLGLEQIRVASAGVWAAEGQPASELAAVTLRARGVELGEHRSRPVTISLLQEADIVIVMEEAQRRSLFYLAPQYLGKVYLLSELSGRHEDIIDPFGGTPEEYKRTADLLEELIDAGMPKLVKALKL